MAEAESTVAVSVGSQRISMALFEPAKGGGLILKAYGSSQIMADPSQEMMRLPQIGIALRELIEKLNVKKERIRYALSGHAVFTRFVKLPPLDEDNLDQLVEFEAQQHVPFPLDEVVWDWQLIESSGAEKEVVLVAIKAESLNEVNDIVAESGLGTQEVDVAPMALYNSFRYSYPEAVDSVLLVDIGAKATNLVYVEGDRLFTRSIAVGGASISTAIAKEYSVPFQEAENQKITNGMVVLGGGHSEQLDEATAGLATVIRNALTRLPAEIARTTTHWRTQHEGTPPTKVYLAGAGANLPYLPEFLEEKLRVPIEAFNPLKRISVAKNLDVEQLGLEAHMLGELVGLGLRGIEETKVRIDLVPRAVEQERQSARRKPFLIAAAMILLAGIGVWAASKASLAGEAEARAKDSRREVSELQPAANAIDSLTRTREELDRVSGAYAAAQEGRVRWAQLVKELQEQFASGAVWVTDLAPVAAYEPLKPESGQGVVEQGFATAGYGDSPVAKIRPPRSSKGKGKGKNAPSPKVMINAVRLQGFWRDNPAGSRAVNAIVEKIKADEDSSFKLTVTEGKGNAASTRPMTDTEIFVTIEAALEDPNLAASFTMTLPLANPIPMD